MKVNGKSQLSRANVRIRIAAALLVLFQIVFAETAYADGDAADSGNPAKVYGWLLAQQAPTGLLGNQENEYFCGVYTNALAAICYIHQGDIAGAERIFAFFDGHLDSVAKELPGGFVQFWDAQTGGAYLESDRWVGDNAWLLIALNYHYYITGKNTYAQMRRTIAEWLISLQDTDGGIMSGYNADGLMWWKSTEGNLDCYVALVEYPNEQNKIGQFLQQKMWIPAESRFRMGSTVAESALDGCSLGVAVFGGDYAAALQYAETALARQKRSDATGSIVAGFSDFVGDDRIWLEGTGQMVVAYHVGRQPGKAEQFLSELDKAMMPSPRYPDTVGLPCHTNDPAWATGSTNIFVPSQAWYLFGAWRFNPMSPEGYRRRLGDLDEDGRTDFKDFCLLAQRWSQQKPLADIAPQPSGDDRTDFLDLAQLARNWLTATQIPPLPGQAANPDPPDGTPNVGMTKILSWTAGSDATSHDVYFGSTDPPVLQSNQSHATYDPGRLNADRVYYWRVDEVNQWGKTTGQVWTFRTVGR